MARVIDQVLGATTSSVVGEITRELVNASDGAGLHLEAGGTITLTNSSAAAFGTSDFSLEFVLNRTANNTNNNVIYESHSAGNNRITLKALTGGDLVATFTNSSGVNADYNTGYDIDVDLNTVTHYALTFDRSGDLTVYKNGNSVATISIAASSAVDIGASNTNTGRIGYVTTYGIIGTFYRFRTWNKLVDAKALYERADVPFADQYGSAANIVGGYDFSTWATSNSTNVNATTQNITGASGWWRKVYSLNAGFKHRIRLVGTQQSGQNFYIRDYDGSATALTDITNTTGTVSAAGLVEGTSFDVTATYTPDSDGYMLQVGAGTGNIEISTFEVHQIGCISDYDLAYAQPALSTLIQDRSNAADGVASSTGVTQVQPITQLNSTSARIGSTQLAAGTAPYIPADGEIISSGKISANAKVNINSNGTLDWGNAADYGVLSWGGATDAIVRGAASKNLQLGANNQNFVTISTSGNVGVGDSTPTSPGGAARFVEISGTSASLVLTDSDAATWEWISAGGNLKAAKDGFDYLSIDSSGNVNVDGGGYVKIGPADTQADLRLYRDDATINTSGIAIGDINFGGADADNDNAARLRVKSDGAWTSTSSPTAFEFQTCPSGSESPQTRLVIGSTGDVTVNESVAIGTSPTAGISLNVRENSTTTAADIRNANASGFGLYVAGGSSSSQYAFRAANKDNTALFTVRGDGLAEFSGGITVKGTNNWSHISAKDTQSLTLADDAQIQIADVEAGAMLIHIYDRGAGRGGLIFAAYGGQPVILADPSSAFANSDTDNKFCVYKSSSSHDVYFKNRIGSSTLFGVLVTAAILDDF